jgi:hypothetical protein
MHGLGQQIIEFWGQCGSVEPRDPEDDLLEEIWSTINPLLVAAQSGHAASLQALLKESRPNRA